MTEETPVVDANVDTTYEFTRWKFLTLLVGGLLVVGGIVAGGPVEGEPTIASDDPALVTPGVTQHGFTAAGTPSGTVLPSELPAAGGPHTEHRVSPAMVRGGFGLILGFCIGFAARVFLKMAAFVVGAALLIVFLFGYLGWVEIRWDVMSDQANGILSSLGEQFASFRSFVTGHIPSTGAAGLGLVVGWRKQ